MGTKGNGSVMLVDGVRSSSKEPMESHHSAGCPPIGEGSWKKCLTKSSARAIADPRFFLLLVWNTTSLICCRFNLQHISDWLRNDHFLAPRAANETTVQCIALHLSCARAQTRRGARTHGATAMKLKCWFHAATPFFSTFSFDVWC